MEEGSEQDKSELPTLFKLTRAREKGQVARGTDLGFLTGLCAFLGFAWIAGPSLGSAVADSVRNALIGSAGLADGHGAVFASIVLLNTAPWPSARPALP